MRYILSTSFLFITFINGVQATDSVTLSDQADRINYAIGHQIGVDFKRQKVILDELAFRQGIQDSRGLGTGILIPLHSVSALRIPQCVLEPSTSRRLWCRRSPPWRFAAVVRT